MSAGMLGIFLLPGGAQGSLSISCELDTDSAEKGSDYGKGSKT